MNGRTVMYKMFIFRTKDLWRSGIIIRRENPTTVLSQGNVTYMFQGKLVDENNGKKIELYSLVKETKKIITVFIWDEKKNPLQLYITVFTFKK